jgi:UDP-N-acetylmuramyl pentapeptide phosphotransferase/UDP-N-acetylglucosamine-1-phosphate transferase
MLHFLAALVTALVTTLLIIRVTRRHGHRSHDDDVSGPQKIHGVPVARIGGVGIVAGVGVGAQVLGWRNREAGELLGMMVACAMPAFISGLVEDIAKNVSPMRRLIATAISAGLATTLLDAVILRTGWGVFDHWLTLYMPLSTAVTVFTVVGVTNAVNIIDGFNGLASMCVVIMLLATGYVSFQVGDWELLSACLVCAGAVLGFFAWNYPAGLVFLGDGGAYLLGFLVSELSILLLQRHPSVSPMFPLLVCIYPVVETVFSIYRRRFIRKTSPGRPDGVHLHHLIFKRVLRWTIGRQDARAAIRRNSMTAPYLWTLCLSSVTPAVLFWNRTAVLFVFVLLFVGVYVLLYWRIVRFRSPRWMGSAARRDSDR